MICKYYVLLIKVMQESVGLKSDWLAEIKPSSRKKPNISLYMSLSKILLQIESKDTGR